MAAENKVSKIDLGRPRGDTFPVRFTIRDAKTKEPIDLTGYTGFLLSVNTSEEPTDETDQVFQSTGAIVSPATDGVCEFPISAGNADQTPNTYFYDAQFTDGAGNKRTFARGEWGVFQDITKD